MSALLTALGIACLFVVIVMGALGLAGFELRVAEPVDADAVADDDELLDGLAAVPDRWARVALFRDLVRGWRAGVEP